MAAEIPSEPQKATPGGRQFDLKGFVSNVTWRDLLLEMVERKEIDPWDIDISMIIKKYVEEVRKIKSLNLSLPANMILATSLLYRLKSDAINFWPASAEDDGDQDGDGLPPRREGVEVSPLIYRSRIRPGRRVTLDELIDALEEMMKRKVRREELMKGMDIPLQLNIESEDIDEKIERAYGLIERNKDSYGYTTFSALSSGFGGKREVVLDLFLPLLFLAQSKRIVLSQPEFFEEIIIGINGNAGNENA